MNLDKDIIPAGLKVVYTQRVYYSQYRTKLTFEIDKSKLIRTPNSQKMSYWSHRYHTYLNLRELVNALERRIKKVIPEGSVFRMRHELHKITVFTNDIETIENLLVGVHDRLIELEHPMNEKHADVIENHRKVIVRNSLFANKYKFKIYMKYDYKKRESRYKELEDYLKTSSMNWDVNSALFSMFYTTKNTKFIGYTLAVYLNDADDLMMFQLRYNDEIQKVEEIVLLEDMN